MPAHRPEHEADTGRLGAAISNAVVRLLAEYTGRGPTKARTTIRSDMVIVLLQDTLTKGERVLVTTGVPRTSSPCAASSSERCAKRPSPPSSS